MNKKVKYLSYGTVIVIAWFIVFRADFFGEAQNKKVGISEMNAFLSCKLPKNTKLLHFSHGSRIFVYDLGFQSSYFSFEKYEEELMNSGWERIDNLKRDSVERIYRRGDCSNRIQLVDESEGKWKEYIVQETKK